MEWKEMTKGECEKLFNSDNFVRKSIDDDFPPRITTLNKDYTNIRQSLINGYSKAYSITNMKDKKWKYNFDIAFGIEVHKRLASVGFGEYEASNDDIWRYIQMEVIPDILWFRWKNYEGRENYNPTDHFYSMPRRLWLKTIWYYVNETIQTNQINGYSVKDYDKTHSLLKKFDTDTIMNLVERPGKEGYVDGLNKVLMAEMLKRHAFLSKIKNYDRKVFILNNAYLQVYNPKAYDGGIEAYAKMIVMEVINNEGVLS